MQHWEDHGFAPTGPLQNKGTHVEVYPDNSPQEWKTRARQLKPPNYPRLDRRAESWEIKHDKQRRIMREDKQYQFIMLVASFANLRINQMWRTPAEDPGKAAGAANESAGQLGGIGPDNEPYEFQHRWTSSPLISGTLYLSPKVFGHLMEAESIVRRSTNTSRTLEQLMEDDDVRTLFARLVALRINMSAFLSGINYQLDRNYRRLMAQQSMVMHGLKARLGSGTSTSRSLPVMRKGYERPRRQTFNNMVGRFTLY